MKIAILLAVVIALIIFLLYRRRGKKFIVQSPRLGILCLQGAGFPTFAAADKSRIAGTFSSVEESNAAVPTCDVLFLYCDIGADGKIAGATSTLREMIRDSGAAIVVVASENPGDNYIAAARSVGYGRANLVMTIQRKGDAFASFFSHLFEQMFSGTSMPVAWVKLAPQMPGLEHKDCPETIFACELGQIAFA